MAGEKTTSRAAAAGRSSRFTATFGLLRQYIKEQGGGVTSTTTMGLMPVAGAGDGGVAEEETKTMELFPQQAGMLKLAQPRREPESAQLTIFYGGRAMVFDDFPAGKANELMQLASSVNTPAAGAAAFFQDTAPGLQPCLPDMPIARKASLQRFLEKRKSRLAAAEPYSLDLAPAPAAKQARNKPVKDGGAPWLGVNSMLDLN